MVTTVLTAGVEEPCSFDQDFFSVLERTQPIQRDTVLAGCLNKIIQTSGTVQSLIRMERYKKKFRVTLLAFENEKSGLRMTVHLFSEQADTVGRLASGDRFQFSGQLIAVTPLNSRRTAYILDVVLEKGAILVE